MSGITRCESNSKHLILGLELGTLFFIPPSDPSFHPPMQQIFIEHLLTRLQPAQRNTGKAPAGGLVLGEWGETGNKTRKQLDEDGAPGAAQRRLRCPRSPHPHRHPQFIRCLPAVKCPVLSACHWLILLDSFRKQAFFPPSSPRPPVGGRILTSSQGSPDITGHSAALPL